MRRCVFVVFAVALCAQVKAEDVQIKEIKPLLGNYYKKGLWLPMKISLFSKDGFEGTILLKADTGLKFSRNVSVGKNSTCRFIIPVIIFSSNPDIVCYVYKNTLPIKQEQRQLALIPLEQTEMLICIVEPYEVDQPPDMPFFKLNINELGNMDYPAIWDAVDYFVTTSKTWFSRTLNDQNTVHSIKDLPRQVSKTWFYKVVEPSIFNLFKPKKWIPVNVSLFVLFAGAYAVSLIILLLILPLLKLRKWLFIGVAFLIIICASASGYIFIKPAVFEVKVFNFNWENDLAVNLYFIHPLVDASASLNFDCPVYPIYTSYPELANDQMEIVFDEEFGCELRSVKFKAGKTRVFFSNIVRQEDLPYLCPQFEIQRLSEENLSITNITRHTISNITIIYEGFFKRIERLEPAEKRIVSLKEGFSLSPPDLLSQFIVSNLYSHGVWVFTYTDVGYPAGVEIKGHNWYGSRCVLTGRSG